MFTTTMDAHRWFRGICWLIVFSFSAKLGNAGSLGTRPYSNYERLRVTYNPDPIAYCNCNEMTITVTTAIGKPSLVDRELEVVLYVAGYYRSSVAYRTRLTLPAGATSATTKLYYRQPYSYASWLVDVLENDRSIVLPEPVPSFVSFNQAAQGLDCCEIGLPVQTAGAGLPFDYTVNGFNVSNIQVQNAPTDWRVYLRFGFVVWPFEQLASASDAQLEALSAYVLSGGTLVTYFVQPNELKDMDRYLARHLLQAEVDYRWTPISESDAYYGNKRPHGGGHVLCLKSVPPNFGSILKTSNLFPVSDFANDATIDDLWFWRNLVKTVGKTPVWTFNIVVILFAAIVGPGLLIFTNRIRQRTLMLFLVPCISALLTVLVLFYNIVREGFDTRGRIASIQYFDSHTGRGHAWSRQSFFSGAPPAEGLKYSHECLLNPVDTNQQMYGMMDPRNRIAVNMVSDGQSQYLQRWLAPRSQQQVSVGHPLRDIELPIQVLPVPPQRIKVTNVSEFELPIVVLRGTCDYYYHCNQLPASQTVELEPLSLVEVESQLLSQLRDLVPEAPPEVDTSRSRIGNRTRYWSGYSGGSFHDPLEKVLSSRSVVGLLSEFGYFIVTPHAPNVEAPFPAEVFDKEQNFHVLIGSNPW